MNEEKVTGNRMAALWPISVLEFKRFFRLFNILILIPILAVCVYFNLKGTREYKANLKEKEDFRKIEELIFKEIPTYTDYSSFGIRVFFMPSAASIFFANPGAMSEISAHFNSLESLAIYTNCKGKSLFTGSSWRQIRFSYIVFILGTLLSMFIGHGSLRDREYLKSRSSSLPYWLVFLYVVIIRFLFIAAVFLFFMAGMILLVLVHNIQLTASDYTVIGGYVLNALGTLLLFFLIGVISGIVVPGKWAGAALNMGIWLAIFFIVNNTINSIAVEGTDKIPANYATFKQKLKMLDDYEAYAEEKYGKKKDAPDETRKMAVEDYWRNFYPRIEAIDTAVKYSISEIVKNSHEMTIIAPTTNYLTVCDESSSRGYDNFMEFFAYLVQLRRKFSRFWIDRFYYHDPNVMVNFIKGDENIFTAKSRLPGNYWAGIRITLVYNLILFLTAFLLFKIFYFKVYNRSLSQLQKLAAKLDTGKITMLLTASDILKNQIYFVLASRTKGFKGKFMLGNVNIAEAKYKVKILYLCKPGDIPLEITVKNYFTYFTRLYKIPAKHAEEIKQRYIPETIWNRRCKKLKNADKINLLLAVANLKEFPLYVFDDTAAGMYPEFVKQFKKELEALAGKDKAVLYITRDIWHSPMISSEPISLMKNPEDIHSINEPNFV